MDAAIAFVVGVMVGVILGFVYAALMVAAHNREEDHGNRN